MKEPRNLPGWFIPLSDDPREALIQIDKEIMVAKLAMAFLSVCFVSALSITIACVVLR